MKHFDLCFCLHLAVHPYRTCFACHIWPHFLLSECFDWNNASQAIQAWKMNGTLWKFIFLLPERFPKKWISWLPPLHSIPLLHHYALCVSENPPALDALFVVFSATITSCCHYSPKLAWDTINAYSAYKWCRIFLITTMNT